MCRPVDAERLMMLNVPAYYQEQLMLSAAETPMSAFPTGMPPATPSEPKLVSVALVRTPTALHIQSEARCVHTVPVCIYPKLMSDWNNIAIVMHACKIPAIHIIYCFLPPNLPR
eukprot:scaffold35955_cov18-Tisochrysis_lutea.AAC.2